MELYPSHETKTILEKDSSLKESQAKTSRLREKEESRAKVLKKLYCLI